MDLDEPPAYYQGRKWDAPFTDDAAERNLSGHKCSLCQEQITSDDNAFAGPYMVSHLECYLRSGMGDVQHLEQRCLCYRGSGNEIVHDSDRYETYRDSARAALQWLVDNHRGRFHRD